MAQAEKARRLRNCEGWSDLVLPYISQQEETANRFVMRRPGSGAEQEFIKGYAAALVDFKEFISGVADEDTRVLLEQMESEEVGLVEEEEERPGSFRRFG